MLASRAERWVLGVVNDPSAAIEVSLGGLPPKGGGSEGERRSGVGPGRVYKGGRRITGSASDACLKAERFSIEPAGRYTRRVSNVFRGFTP